MTIAVITIKRTFCAGCGEELYLRQLGDQLTFKHTPFTVTGKKCELSELVLKAKPELEEMEVLE